MLEALKTGRHAGERQGSVALGEADRHRLARRAEALMRTRLDDPMTIRELCETLGSAERTLYLGFRECFGMSPMAYFKGLRLEAVHRDLRRSRASTTVTDTATKWGFFQFGEFAAAYRAQFGELPSQTLRGAAHVDAPCVDQGAACAGALR
jgi:AraC family transcriptional regulator, ethanolamine operon transcriptional activator